MLMCCGCLQEQLLAAANLAKDMDTAFAAVAKASDAANGKKRNAGDDAGDLQKEKKKDKNKAKKHNK